MKTEFTKRSSLKETVKDIILKKKKESDPKRSKLQEGMIGKETGIHVGKYKQTLIVIMKKHILIK